MIRDKLLTYCWDTNVIISLITQKGRTPEELSGLNDVLNLIVKKKANLIISTICDIELLPSKMSKDERKKLHDFLKHRNIMKVPTSEPITELATEIRDYYSKKSEKLSVPDCINLATAIIYKVDEFHTYDEGRKSKDIGLLSLNGNVANHVLKICKPSLAQLSLPLL